MSHPNPHHVRTVIATLVVGAAAALAQTPLDLRLEVVDTRGTTWDVSTDAGPIDLTSASGTLELRALPLVDGAASLSVTFDGVTVATVDLEAAEREIVAPVARGADDVEEIVAASTSDPNRWPAGFTYGTGSDLELGIDPSHGPQIVYVAFGDLGIAAGAEVVRAAVRFTADGASEGPLALRVAGVTALAADAVLQNAEGSASATLSTAVTTLRTIDWVPEPAWRPGEVHETPDLSAIATEAWTDPVARATGTLAFVFAIAEGDGTRRAFSFDGNRRAAPTLVLVAREPSAATIPIDVPAGTTEVTVTLHPERAGQRDPIASSTFRIVVAATEAAATPTEPPIAAAPELAPSSPTEPATVDGTPAILIAELLARADGSSQVTIVLVEPVGVAVVPALRFGTCAAPGDLLTPLTEVPAGERGSTTVVGVSATALRLSGLVAVLEGVPGTCTVLRP